MYIRSRQHPDTLDDGTTLPGKANGTINRELGILQRVLKLAARRRKLARVPTITLLREDNARQGFLERDQSYLKCKYPEDWCDRVPVPSTI